MESFSLLKYWRGGGAGAGNQRGAGATTTIAAAVSEDGGGGGGGDVDDDASFFDLEFAVPADESAASDAEEERVEFDFAVAGDVAAGEGARTEALCPSDDLFFKGKLVTVEPTSGESGDGKEAAAPPSQLPAASFLRSATKFRVLLLKLRKPKPSLADGGGGGSVGAASLKPSRLLIKFRVDDAPIISLFTRDNSSRITAGGAAAGAAKAVPPATEVAPITAEERRFAKEVVLKYLNKIKPLYVKVSRRYGERLRFSASEGEETDAEPEPSPSPSPSPAASSAPAAAPPAAPPPAAPVVVACGVRAPRASVPAGLKQVCKRLGKSRSASAAVAAAPSPPASSAPPPPPPPQPQRRDDSLLQLQDGIQSAIAHCKRSFNASKGSESPLLRSMSDPGDGRLDKKKNANDDGA